MWIESHQSLRDHPKTRKLARRVGGIAKAIGHLHCLWWWCIDYAPDGDVTKYEAEDIAIGADWDGDPQEFIKALIDSGFVTNGDGLRINDWYDYAGKLVERREQNRLRAKEWREKKGAYAYGTHTERKSNALQDLPTNLKRDRVIHRNGKPPVDNCPVCTKKHEDNPLTPDEQMRPHCAVCGYVKKAKP
jgi:hypothetical protein